VGVIDSTTATTFEIGNLTVDYSIADIGGIAAGVIVAGKLKQNLIGKICVEANVNFVSVAIKSVTVLGNIFQLDDKPCCRIAAAPR